MECQYCYPGSAGTIDEQQLIYASTIIHLTLVLDLISFLASVKFVNLHYEVKAQILPKEVKKIRQFLQTFEVFGNKIFLTG